MNDSNWYYRLFYEYCVQWLIKVFEHCYKKIYSKILNEQIYDYINRTYRVKYGTIFLLRKNLKSINSYR